jgi:hypothetical protein
MLTRALLTPAILAALQCAPLIMQAQWLNYPAPGAPRTRDGKVNLNAPAPRTRIWHERSRQRGN